MKDKEIIILLLQIIKFNGDINHLLINGCDHKTIINMLREFDKEKMTTTTKSQLVLTQKGEAYLDLLNKELKRKGLYKYISPCLENRCTKMNIEDIYIPLQKVKKAELFSLSHENVKIVESSIDNELPF